MKTTTIIALILTAGLLSAGAFAETAPTSQNSAPATALASGGEALSGEIVSRLKGFTFEQRAEFSRFVAGLEGQSDAAIDELTADYTEMLATPARRAAMDELMRSEAVFKNSISALDDATIETWDSIKSDIVLSWVNLQSALAKARQEKT